MAKTLVYVVPATEVETNHVSVQLVLIRNQKGELSATASLVNHSGAVITSLPFGPPTLNGFESFMKSLYDELRTRGGVKTKEG